MALSHDNLSGPGRPPRGDATVSVRDKSANPVDLEATLPPTPVRELLAASGASLFVLATDVDFVAAIRRAAGDRYPLFVVESWNELKDAADSGRCGIALLDAALLGRRVGECIAALAAHADRLVTLVAADRAAAHEYVGLLSDGRIHRLLIKPPAIGATRLLIDSAVARRLQLRDASANDDAPPVAASTVSMPRWGWTVVAAVVAVALLTTAIAGSELGWWNGASTAEVATTGEAAAASATPVTPPPVPSPTEQMLAARRASATLALQEGRIAEPAGDNALEHYLAILALEPTDTEARSQLSGLVQTLFTRAEEALLAGSLDTAAAALDHVRRVDPASSRLAFLDAQLARSLAALAAPPAAPASQAPPPVAAVPTELDSVVSLAAARLRRGQLLNPPGDSAVAYLDRAVGLNAAEPRVVALRADLTAALLEQARLVSTSDVAAATALVTEARRLGGESAAVVAVERDIGSTRARDEQRFAERLATARQRVQGGALFAPANDSALDHLARLQADAPTLAGLADAWEAFRQAAARAIQSSIAAREWARAESELQALARAPAGAVVAAPLAAELAARQQQEIYLATAAAPSALTLLSSVPVVYPMDELEQGVEGWVDVDLIVDRNGQPRNITVVDASPPSRFNAAAIAAVEQYRYAPFERDGRVYERRVRFRLRFTIE
jgi:TonB family protein